MIAAAVKREEAEQLVDQKACVDTWRSVQVGRSSLQCVCVCVFTGMSSHVCSFTIVEWLVLLDVSS